MTLETVAFIKFGVLIDMVKNDFDLFLNQKSCLNMLKFNQNWLYKENIPTVPFLYKIKSRATHLKESDINTFLN